MDEASLQLFESFERLSLDRKLTFFLNDDKGTRVIVSYERNLGRPWSVWQHGLEEETRRNVSRIKLGEVLTALNCTLYQLESEVKTHLLWQAAYCDHFVREVSELIGSENVRRSILDTQNFMDEMSEAVSQVLGTPQQQEPPASETTTGESSSPKKGKLRIISGK